MLKTKFLEKIKHRYYDQFFPENRFLYEIIWENMVVLDSTQVAV